MPPIKITSAPGGITRVWVNGVEVHDLVSIDVHTEHGEPIRVALEMYAAEAFELYTDDAHMTIGLRLPIGFALRTQRMADGSMRLWCEHEPVITH